MHPKIAVSHWNLTSHVFTLSKCVRLVQHSETKETLESSRKWRFIAVVSLVLSTEDGSFLGFQTMEPPNKRKPHAPRPVVLSITPAGILLEDRTIGWILVTTCFSPISINKIFCQVFRWNYKMHFGMVEFSSSTFLGHLKNSFQARSFHPPSLALQNQRKRAPSGRRFPVHKEGLRLTYPKSWPILYWLIKNSTEM